MSEAADPGGAAVKADERTSRARRRLFAAAREAAIDADGRRELQRRLCGKNSAADMTAAEMHAVADEIARCHGRSAAVRDQPPPKGAAKLRALWISGYWLGVVEDRYDTALCAWLRRYSGVEAARWMTPRQVSVAVEGLRAWLARAPDSGGGGVAWTREGDPRHDVLRAQWRRLHALGLVRIADRAALDAYAARHARIGRKISVLHLTAAQADALIQHLGERIRRARSAQP